MNALVIGQGGREHALVRALSQSSSVKKIYAFPGNPGMARDAEVVAGLDLHSEGLIRFCRDHAVDLVVVGPESELLAGVADRLRLADVHCFGPGADGAALEGSKIYAKEFLNAYKIPTARAWVVTTVEELKAAAQHVQAPYVLKADGLCAGKGVFVCKNLEELLHAGHSLFVKKVFGPSGERALLEEFMPGEEISYFVLTNSRGHVSLPVFRDHKRLCDGNEGPNTGGMGVVGPVDLGADLLQKIENDIVRTSVEGLLSRGIEYRGVLFIGIMLTEQGPKVLEYNVRFGDPEAQTILPLLDGDWGRVFADVAAGTLPSLKWKNEKVACVVLAADGYPEAPKKGAVIEGDLSDRNSHQYVLQAGTATAPDGRLTVNGGRVLNAIGIALDLKGARQKAYELAAAIHWPGMQYRRDIGN